MFKKARVASFALLALLVGGCSTVTDFIFRDDRKNAVDTEVIATYFDGPKVRPGVALGISVTAAGQIKVNGLTLVELQQKVADAYKEYFLEPRVNATFIYQAGANMVSPWGTVTVLGEVARPGPVDVPSTMDLRVTRALQLAGGVTAIADKRGVKVTRCDKDGKQTVTYVDLIEMGEKGRPDKDMILKAGDVVWVPMSWY